VVLCSFLQPRSIDFLARLAQFVRTLQPFLRALRQPGRQNVGVDCGEDDRHRPRVQQLHEKGRVGRPARNSQFAVLCRCAYDLFAGRENVRMAQVAWRKSKDFRNASQVSTWIIGIAYRTAIREQRRQKRYATWLSLDECTESCVDSTVQTETRDWLRQGLGSLSRDQQLALLLSYGAGYAVDEIAALTFVPVGTVKTRLFHARNKLRRFLPVISGQHLLAPEGESRCVQRLLITEA
jgi:RNA polymerase sigma factor (sigma-70 family)